MGIVLAVCAGIYHQWKLGLVGACYVPLLLVSSTFQARIIASHDNIEKEALATSAKVWHWRFLSMVWITYRERYQINFFSRLPVR